MKYPVILYLLASACLTAASPAASAADATHSCEAHVAQWLDPASGKVIAPQGLFARIADSKIVLLGEVHTSKAHHIWQHYMLAALHSRKPDTIVGMEMLPRRVPPALDAWSAGKLDEASFLQQSEWADLWGYDPALYLPLLRLARLERMPVVALNIDRRLVSRVAEQGWQSIPAGDRLGLSDPAPASADPPRASGGRSRWAGGGHAPPSARGGATPRSAMPDRDSVESRRHDRPRPAAGR